MIKGLQYETCKYCLREMDLFSLKKEKLKEDFTAVFNYLVYGCREAGSRIFLVVHNKRRTGTNCNKGNSSNVFEKNEFTMSVKHQNRLPREIWMKPEPPDWTTKPYPTSKSALLWTVGWTRWLREISFNYSLILVYNTHIPFSTSCVPSSDFDYSSHIFLLSHPNLRHETTSLAVSKWPK